MFRRKTSVLEKKLGYPKLCFGDAFVYRSLVDAFLRVDLADFCDLCANFGRLYT